jgi:uncharacterized protein YegL
MLALLLSLAVSPPHPARPRIDVAFALDTTGSMADEIEVVKEKIVEMARKIADGDPRPDVRFGVVAYRDRGDLYVTRAFAFSREIADVQKTLSGLTADGGGDEPEAVAEGLDSAVHELSWDFSRDTARMIFLIGDAGPHEYPDGKDWRKVASEAAEKGITISAIGCSGLNPWAERVFGRIARLADGQLSHLTYTRVATGPGGKRISVLTEGGKTFVADRELSADDWKKGAGALAKEGKVHETRNAPAAAGPMTNNLDAAIVESVKARAAKSGVRY